MKFKFKINYQAITLIACFITNAFILQAAIDPDASIKDALSTFNTAGSAIDTATLDQLTGIETVLNAAYAFFSADSSGTPAYQPGLDLIGAATNPAAGTLRKKVADRKIVLTGGTPTPTPTPTISINQQVINAINQAMTQKTVLLQISELNKIVTTKKDAQNLTLLKSAKVTDVVDTTRNLFAGKIMAVGGTLIVSINTYALKTSYTATDKKNIKALLAANTALLSSTTTISNFGTALKTLLTNAVKTNLLTAAQKTYINNTLLKAPMVNLQKNVAKLKTIK